MNAEPIPLRIAEECAMCEALRQTCDALAAERDEEVRNRERAERDLRGKRTIIENLKAELAGQRRSSPHYDDAVTIFEFWKKRCRPRARSFGDDRLKAVLGILKSGDYSPRYICESIIGYSVDPPMRGTERYDDLELICRGSKHVERGHDTYLRHGGICRCEQATEEERDAAGL